MYQNLPINPQLYNIGFLLAQVPVEQSTTTTRVEETALLYSGPQFFIALIAGVVLACAFQLLLTNLSVAAGFPTSDNPTMTDTTTIMVAPHCATSAAKSALGR
jgi:hypothetical protein